MSNILIIKHGSLGDLIQANGAIKDIKKFYKNRKDMLDKLDLFNSHNINFLVFGRKVDSRFISLKNVSLPEHIKRRFTGFDEEIIHKCS